MADPVWGELNKSQDNSQKIEQRVAEMIATHEADPEAHMGPGESIENHRQNEIIDHPAFSIVADKFSPNQPLFQTLFESIDGWQLLGNHYNSLLVLRVGAYGDQVGDSYVYNEGIEFAQSDDDYTILDNMYQLKFLFSNFNNIGDIYFGMGVSDSVPTGYSKLCWKIIDNTIYSGFAGDDSIVWVSHGIIGESQRHTVSVVSSREFQEVYFYLNGVLVRTESVVEMEEPFFTNYGVYFKKTGGTTNAQSKFFYQQYLMWSTGEK